MNSHRCIYRTADEVAALSERMRPTLLAWARRSFPSVSWDHEEVLQDVLARLTLDSKVRGTEDHVRACLYHGLRCGLINRLHRERARHTGDFGHFQPALEQTPDPDKTIDPLACAIHACEHEALASLLAQYTEIEQRLIRMRYRGGIRARKNDGVISRVQCADVLGITLAELRSMERRVFSRLAATLAPADESRGSNVKVR